MIPRKSLQAKKSLLEWMDFKEIQFTRIELEDAIRMAYEDSLVNHCVTEYQVDYELNEVKEDVMRRIKKLS